MISTVRTLSQLTSNSNLKFEFRITKQNLCILIFCFVPISFFWQAQEKVFAETRETSCICPSKTASTYSSKFVCLFAYFSLTLSAPGCVTTWWWWYRDALRSFFCFEKWVLCIFVRAKDRRSWKAPTLSVQRRRWTHFGTIEWNIYAQNNFRQNMHNSFGWNETAPDRWPCNANLYRQPLFLSFVTVQITPTDRKIRVEAHIEGKLRYEWESMMIKSMQWKYWKCSTLLARTRANGAEEISIRREKKVRNNKYVSNSHGILGRWHAWSRSYSIPFSVRILCERMESIKWKLNWI